MIDKKISLGTIITIGTIIGTFVYTQGIFAQKIESVESNNSNSTQKIMSNSNKIQSLEVSVAKIETKLDERFNRIEELLMDLE
jgi:peptidoglycan hydrolase CwlO-like protein